MRDRLSRFLGKKKGNRRSGSPQWGIFIDVFVSVSLVLAGVILLVATSTLLVQQQQLGWMSLLSRFVIGILFLGFGIYNLLKTLWLIGTSAERRGAIVSLARDVELFNELGSEEPSHPNVPSIASMKRFKGHRLAFRLPSQEFAQMGFWANVAMTLTFIIVSTILVMYCVQSIQEANPRWILIVLTLIHLSATVFQFISFVRLLVRSTALGPSRMEVSSVPFSPGESFDVFFSQSGRLFMKLVDIELVCFEQATFNQGTDIRTESRAVYRQRVFRQRGVAIQAGDPLERQFDFEIPKGVMHSFVSDNNQVHWKIVVTCVAKGWPKFERAFPVVMTPATVS